MIRIIHTSDWHLGKRLFKLERLEEQKKFLDWLLTIIIEKEIDLLINSGDIFDIPNPPHQAIKLFYDFLDNLTSNTNCEFIGIAGNHDGPIFLEAPSKILSSKKIHLKGTIEDSIHHWLDYKKDGHTCHLFLLPFFRSYDFSNDFDNPELILKKISDFIKIPDNKIGKKILVAHHLFGIPEASGSEQLITLSGLASIPLDILKNFDQVCLGHIHKPQVLKKESPTIAYSGSPIALRFSEKEHKRVRLLEITDTIIETNILIPIFRKLISLKTTQDNWQEDLSRALISNNELESALELEITFHEAKPQLLETIKDFLKDKNTLLLSYMPQFPEFASSQYKLPDLSKLGPLQLFETFYKLKYPESEMIDPELKKDFLHLLSQAQDEIKNTQN